MFDMAADLRGLFTWNTKLVFVYVTAEYKTELNALNQIVIWDYIIEDVEHSQLTVGRAQTMLLPRHHNEYPLIDQVSLPCHPLCLSRPNPASCESSNFLIYLCALCIGQE